MLNKLSAFQENITLKSKNTTKPKKMNNKASHPSIKLLLNLKEYFINNTYLLLFTLFAFFTNQLSAQTTETYNASGNWTVPPSVTSVTVQIWGAGGGGGGSSNSGDGGSGGGSGAYVTRIIPVTAGNNFTYTIGTGGIAGTAAAGTGGNGGNSIITIGGFTLTANGGTGGAGNEGAVGIGGAATGGTTNTNGNNGVVGGNNGGKGGDHLMEVPEVLEVQMELEETEAHQELVEVEVKKPTEEVELIKLEVLVL